MARFLKIPGSHSVWFFVGFRIFGFLWFESRSRFVDHGDRSQHRFDAFGRPGNNYAAYLWPDFFTFMVHMLVGLFVGSLDFRNPQV